MSNKPTGWSISGSLILLKLHVLSSLLTSVHACMYLRRKNCTSGRRCFFYQHRDYVFALKQDGGKINRSFFILYYS